MEDVDGFFVMRWIIGGEGVKGERVVSHGGGGRGQKEGGGGTRL